VSTTVALVLGLLVYSAKSFYDTQNNEVTVIETVSVSILTVLFRVNPSLNDDYPQ